MLFVVSILRVHKSQIVIFIAHCFDSPLCFPPSVCSVFTGHLQRQELEQQRAETNEQTRLLRERLEHERRQGVWTLRGCQHLGLVERMCYSWFDDGMQLYSYVRFHKQIKPRNLGNWSNFTIFFSNGLKPPTRFSSAKRCHEQSAGSLIYTKLIENKGNRLKKWSNNLGWWITLPESNIFALKINGWKLSFVLGWPIFRVELLVLGSVMILIWF